MKKLILLLFLISISCSESESTAEDPLSKLPTETQVGANTFGCIINGQVFYPRDGTSTLFNPGGKGLILWGSPGGNREYNEIEIRNLKDAKPANSIMIHLQDLDQKGIGEYL